MVTTKIHIHLQSEHGRRRLDGEWKTTLDFELWEKIRIVERWSIWLSEEGKMRKILYNYHKRRNMLKHWFMSRTCVYKTISAYSGWCWMSSRLFHCLFLSFFFLPYTHRTFYGHSNDSINSHIECVCTSLMWYYSP